MKRQTQALLYHLLPAVFWLLAAGGVALWKLFSVQALSWPHTLLPSIAALWCLWIVSAIRRHSSSVEECFQVAVLLAVASYWLPTVVFLIIPIWGYLLYRNLFSFRSVVASLIGCAAVAVWAALFIYLGWIDNPWSAFFASKNAWGWVPTGAILLAWLFSAIARHTLRVR